jgi:hypothetical protein
MALKQLWKEERSLPIIFNWPFLIFPNILIRSFVPQDDRQEIILLQSLLFLSEK